MFNKTWWDGVKDAEKSINGSGLKFTYDWYELYSDSKSEYWEGWLACCRHYKLLSLHEAAKTGNRVFEYWKENGKFPESKEEMNYEIRKV